MTNIIVNNNRGASNELTNILNKALKRVHSDYSISLDGELLPAGTTVDQLEGFINEVKASAKCLQVFLNKAQEARQPFEIETLEELKAQMEKTEFTSIRLRLFHRPAKQ